jgi:hypothetical protein
MPAPDLSSALAWQGRKRSEKCQATSRRRSTRALEKVKPTPTRPAVGLPSPRTCETAQPSERGATGGRGRTGHGNESLLLASVNAERAQQHVPRGDGRDNVLALPPPGREEGDAKDRSSSSRHVWGLSATSAGTGRDPLLGHRHLDERHPSSMETSSGWDLPTAADPQRPRSTFWAHVLLAALGRQPRKGTEPRVRQGYGAPPPLPRPLGWRKTEKKVRRAWRRVRRGWRRNEVRTFSGRRPGTAL